MPLTLSAQDIVLRSNDELYRLFLLTNEKDSDATFWNVSRTAVHENTVLATSGMFSLDVISHRGAEKACNKPIEYLVQFDYSLATKLFWEKLEHIITRHGNPLDAKNAIVQELESNAPIYYPTDSDKQLERDKQNLRISILSGNSWLRSERSYHKVKHIFDKQHFTFLSLDFTDTDAVQNLVNSMSEQNMRLDTIYLSNIHEYSELDRKIQEFRKSVQCLMPLCDKETILIDTEERTKGVYGGQRLIQRITLNITELDLEEHYPTSTVLDK